jgi:putative thioredoxin
MAPASQWIHETTEATFQEDVVDQSMDRPVVVDFWSPSCGPCRELGPMLERLAEEYKGRFALVKINTDTAPRLAQAFRVESIPYVVAISQGRPVDQFVGLLPEPQIREWLTSILPSPVEELFRKGETLEADDPQGAEQAFRVALALQPHDEIRIALVRVLIAQGRDEEATKIIAELEARGFLEPHAQRLKSQLELRAAAGEAGTVREARAAAAENPDNLDLQIKLADVLAVEKKYREALELLLAVVMKDRSGPAGTTAKETMVRIFDLMGPAAELTGEFRRKLATTLY